MRFTALAILALLSACKREPTFDQRYDAAAKHINQTAKEIDAEISATGVPTTGPSDRPTI
jgi:hypothetical protein